MQVHPPTAVTHCTAAWLTHAQRQQGSGSADGDDGGGSGDPLPDLVVVRSTQLELYSVRGSEAGGPATTHTAQSLDQLASCRLFGVAESVAVLRGRAPGQRDVLLLTFRCAPVSTCSTITPCM